MNIVPTTLRRAAAVAAGAVLAFVSLSCSGAAEAQTDLEAAPLATATVRAAGSSDRAGYDGVVQAVRHTTIGAQVPGAVVALEVRAGDAVKAGQVLLRLDARAAEQTAAAGAAQVLAARAAQEAATREFERQKQLFEKNFISRAALDRAEAQHKAAQAEAAAQLASAGAAHTQTGFHVVRAPYAGTVADVSVVLGDMAMPGRPLLSLYDPTALRVSAAVPEMVASRLGKGGTVEVELPGARDGRVAPLRTQVMPTIDPATHTVELRLELPAALEGVAPGMFARAWLPVGGGDARLFVPAAAVVRRAELAAVYVVGADGRPLLRQVRLGPSGGEIVEVLAGLAAGERVALDPQAAARVR